MLAMEMFCEVVAWCTSVLMADRSLERHGRQHLSSLLADEIQMSSPFKSGCAVLFSLRLGLGLSIRLFIFQIPRCVLTLP